MKNLISMLALILAVGCAKDPGATASENGNEGANGGIQNALDASLVMNEAVALVMLNPDLFSGVNFEQLLKLNESVKVYGREFTVANGVETDAINNGSDSITINLSRWKNLDDPKRKALMLHELLGVMGIEKDNYNISQRIVGLEPWPKDLELTCNPGSNSCWAKINFEPRTMEFVLRSNCEFMYTQTSNYPRRFKVTGNGTARDFTEVNHPTSMDKMHWRDSTTMGFGKNQTVYACQKKI